jgi:hypothetical protein
MKSDAFSRIVAGPVGSGKTTACVFELFRRALEQHPSHDGIRAQYVVFGADRRLERESRIEEFRPIVLLSEFSLS